MLHKTKMIVNNVNNNILDDNKFQLKRVITENTRPDTDIINNLCKGNFGFNNLNSVLKNLEDDRIIQYIKVSKTDTTKIADTVKNKLIPNKDNINNNNKDKLCLNTHIPKNTKENIDLYFLPKRFDRFGEPITKGGKQKVTFIDRITKNNFTNVIKIESFKEFNKMEEVSNTSKNNCCIVI